MPRDIQVGPYCLHQPCPSGISAHSIRENSDRPCPASYGCGRGQLGLLQPSEAETWATYQSLDLRFPSSPLASCWDSPVWEFATWRWQEKSTWGGDELFS